MGVEVSAFARQRGVECRRVNPAREKPQRRLDAKPDAVAEQRLVVPRTLNSEQAHENRDPRETRQLDDRTSGERGGRHRRKSMNSPSAKPPTKNQRAPAVE